MSQPLKPTTSTVQQNAKHVIATATLRNIITSVEHIVSTEAVTRKIYWNTIVTSTHGSKRDFFVAHDKDQTSACKEETGQGLRWRPRGKNRAWGAEPDKEIGHATQNCESGEAITPKSMYLNLSLALAHALTVGVRRTHLEKIGLEVSAHCCSGYANHQRGERIKAAAVTGRLRDSTAVSLRGFQGRGGYRPEPTSQTTRFKTHPNQTCEPKHDSDTYVLDLLGGVRITGERAEALHPRVGYAVEENHERLDKFCGDMAATGCAVPCPTHF